MGSALRANSLSVDIFCRVVDNFGDIGVCWRLARQLADTTARPPIRLWVDDLHSFAKIEPAVAIDAAVQTVRGIELVHWTNTPPVHTPHHVVIEAFACDPPPAFIAGMAQQHSLWINLEYLSAEAWVESCHALPSLQSNGLKKYFFFPGFTPKTGGLLREHDLIARRDHWRSQPERRWQLLRQLGVAPKLIEGLQQGWRQVFLFCYPSAPASALVQTLGRQSTPSVILVPAGILPPIKHHASTGPQSNTAHIVEIPFVDQNTFDQLLWSSDVNFVRGEDSLVRALWAGQPLVWQIYEQDEQAHLDKLTAWLDRSPFEPVIHKLMISWNTANEAAVGSYLEQALQPSAFARWQADAAQWSRELAARRSLIQSLLEFCAENRRTG